MKPHICVICKEPLGKNTRLWDTLEGRYGGRVHHNCLETFEYNRHEAYLNRKRLYKQTENHQKRMREKLNGFRVLL